MIRRAVVGLSLAASACGGEVDVAPHPSRAVVAELPVVPTAGGPVLARARIALVSFAEEPATRLEGLFAAMRGSAWLRALGEYGVVDVELVAVRVVAREAPWGVSTDEVAALVDESRVALGLGDELVFVVYPRKTTVHLGGRTGCRALSDFHGAIAGAPYVVLPTCAASGLLDENDDLDVRASRAIANALTNPDPLDRPAYDLDSTTSAWIALGRGVGDLCPYQAHEEGGRWFARVWSNAAASTDREPCVPAPTPAPLFGVTVSPDGVRAPALGAPTTWTLRAFDLGDGAPLELSVIPGAGTLNSRASLDVARVSAGEQALLSTTIAPGAPPDTFVSFVVAARRDGVARYRPVALYLP